MSEKEEGRYLTKLTHTAREIDPEIKFYGRRKGKKIRPYRQSLMDDLLPKITAKFEPEFASTDPNSFFDKKYKEIWLEIGFGNGEHMAEQARQNPDIGIIGCEPFLNGVSNLLTQIDQQNIENIRIWPDDARVLIDALQTDSINKVFVLHPDPWPKKRHRWRRFIQTETLNMFSRIMNKDSILRMASDDPDLAEWMLTKAWQNDNFEWMAECQSDWKVRPDDWFETRYEKKGYTENRPPFYLQFKNI